mgnify:FL=1
MYKRFKKLFDKEEGYILVTSFVVLLVIVILGVVYANLAITQARQAEQHNDRKQAYYYARSGSERAYLELAKGLDKEIEYKFKNFSWDMNEGLKKEDELDKNAKINVKISLYDEDEKIINLGDVGLVINDLEKIKVVSTGKVEDVKVDKRANYRLEYNDITEIPENYNKQADDWSKGHNSSSSLVIQENENFPSLPEGDSTEEAVFLVEPNNNSLMLNPNKTAIYTASIFYFQTKDKTKPFNLGGSLTLHSNRIIFNIELIFEKNNSELCIKAISEEDDVIIYFDKESEIGGELFEGFYTLKDEEGEAAYNVCLPGEKDMLERYYPKKSIENWNQIWY